MTLAVIQAATFLAFCAAYISRDYPSKSRGGEARRRATTSFFFLALGGIVSQLAVIFSGSDGERTLASDAVALGSLVLFLIVASFSIFVWPQRNKADDTSSGE